MKKARLFLVLIIFLIIIVIILKNLTSSDKLMTINMFPQPTVIPTITLTPTPTPILINEESNLTEEIDKLIPEDFSGDYKNLQDLTSQF